MNLASTFFLLITLALKVDRSLAGPCTLPGPEYEASGEVIMSNAQNWCNGRGIMFNPDDDADFANLVLTADGINNGDFVWTDAKPRGRQAGKKYFAWDRGTGGWVRDKRNARIKYSARRGAGCLAVAVDAAGELEYKRLKCTEFLPAVCRLPETFEPKVTFKFVTLENDGMIGE